MGEDPSVGGERSEICSSDNTTVLDATVLCTLQNGSSGKLKRIIMDHLKRRSNKLIYGVVIYNNLYIVESHYIQQRKM